MNVIMLGAPGSGKGTQAGKISACYGIPHVSTGDIFRKNIQEGTPLGKLAKTFMDAGNLVPDEVVIDLVRDRLSKEDCAGGYVLDGFPRTLRQAFELDRVTEIDAVVNMDIPYRTIEERLASRRSCECGAVYSLSDLNGSDICPKCGKKVFVRPDDRPETVKARLAVYDAQTKPLTKFYEDKGLLVNIGNGTIEEQFASVRKALDAL